MTNSHRKIHFDRFSAGTASDILSADIMHIFPRRIGVGEGVIINDINRRYYEKDIQKYGMAFVNHFKQIASNRWKFMRTTIFNSEKLISKYIGLSDNEIRMFDQDDVYVPINVLHRMCISAKIPFEDLLNGSDNLRKQIRKSKEEYFLAKAYSAPGLPLVLDDPLIEMYQEPVPLKINELILQGIIKKQVNGPNRMILPNKTAIVVILEQDKYPQVIRYKISLR